MVSDILAAVAILISGTALWQSLRSRPRPSIAITDRSRLMEELHSSERMPYRVVDIVNHGNADAMDVKVGAEYKGHQTVPSEAGPVQPGRSWRVYMGGLVPYNESEQADFINVDPSLVLDALVVVTWRQAPGFKVRRRQLTLDEAM
ncbi:hypothetical protein [Schumannella luteola]